MAKVLIAADSFKGTMTSAEVGDALRTGLSRAGVEAKVLLLADGGEGTAAALLDAIGGEWATAEVPGPLGRPVEAPWALLADGRAVVEVAAASGHGLLETEERDPWAADTRGTGDLIVAAARAGAERVLVAAGGSSTTDGGEGALRALEEAGIEVCIDVICDVRTPWERAAEVFGPQKGADEEMVRRLAERLDALAGSAPRDPRGEPMTGCAGGLSGGLWAHRGARLVPGASYLLEVVGLESLLASHAVVLTGEGCLDRSTLEGKLVAEVASRCSVSRSSCHAVVGRCDLPAVETRRLGLSSVAEASSPDEICSVATALAQSGLLCGAMGRPQAQGETDSAEDP